MRRVVSSLLATAVAAGTFLTGASAKADQQIAVDWMRALTEANYVAKTGADVLDAPRCVVAGCQTTLSATSALPERIRHPHLDLGDPSAFSFAPRFSLVARDWSSSYKVTGDRLALVDETRLTTSSRMVLGRIRVNQSRISPYAQVGAGQWRIDPYLLPLHQQFTEIAFEGAVGLDVRLIGTWALAAQTSTTMLFREYREAKDAAAPGVSIWNTMFVSKVDF